MEEVKFTKINTYIILIICFSMIGVCIVTGISLLFGFIGSIIFLAYILLNKGMEFSIFKRIITNGLKECKTLYALIILIGATVSIWLASGVVPAMMHYGFKYMKGTNFLFSSFIIISIISFFMGTAVGTISTIGIALLGVGKGFGIPDHILLGVIISGAFIADKVSPISGLLNLTLTTTRIKYREGFVTMMYTLLPTYIITAIIYYFIGQHYDITVSSDSLKIYQEAITNGFNISPYLLLLPFGILVLSVLGVRTIFTISLGLFGGTLVSLFYQNMTLTKVLNSIFFGYKGETSYKIIDDILISGGVFSMIEVLFIVMGAIVLSSLLEESGIIKPIINRVVSNIKTKRGLILKTGLISSILTIITCDQTVGIILPGRVFRSRFKDFKVKNAVLARTISDTGTIIAPLIPWNVNVLIIGTIISSLSVSAYVPYAVLCYISPIMTILAGYFLGND